MLGLWIPLGIVVGWFLLCVALVPFMVRVDYNRHNEISCRRNICKVRRAPENSDGPSWSLTKKRCSAEYIRDHWLVLPFMTLKFVPQAVAYWEVHRIISAEDRVEQLEEEAKEQKIELAKAKELEAKRMKDDMMNFDKLFKMVEKGTVKV